jgi:uncharacterized coiled-coil protein SlyX
MAKKRGRTPTKRIPGSGRIAYLEQRVKEQASLIGRLNQDLTRCRERYNEATGELIAADRELCDIKGEVARRRRNWITRLFLRGI